MKHVIATGTDAASLCVFDPAALPGDLDEQAREGAMEQLEALDRQGSLCWWDTGGDGGYLLHLYVDEEVPAEMRPFLQDPEHRERLLVPSGVLWACGTEYVARDPVQGSSSSPKGGLAKFAHMGGHCRIQPGEYTLTAWRAEWPEDMLKRALEAELGKGKARAGNRLGVFTGITLFAAFALTIVTIGLTIGVLRQSRDRWGELAVWWSGVIGLWALAIVLMRSLTRRERDPRRQAVEQQFPRIVLQLRRKR